MADADGLIRSTLLGAVPHGFLDAASSDARRFDLVPHRGGPVFVRQVHSARVEAVTAPFADEPPEADALVTATPGLALAIRTADCAPVLLWDEQASVIGAAHAGWRGACSGVLEATVAAMERLGAARGAIRAAIGPTIAQPSYEVDAAFRDRLIEQSASDADFFIPVSDPAKAGHYLFDLPSYAARRLSADAGLGQIEVLGRDTYAEEKAFHSYRRGTHRGVDTPGRQISLIALP